MSAALPSGHWRGHYEQYGRRYPQELDLEFADGLVRGEGRDSLGTFTADGEYRVEGDVVRLGWIKTYDGAHSVLYLGELCRGAIVGTWRIPPWDADRFEIRPEDPSAIRRPTAP